VLKRLGRLGQGDEAFCPLRALRGSCPQRGGRGIPVGGIVQFLRTPIGRLLEELGAWRPALHLHVRVGGGFLKNLRVTCCKSREGVIPCISVGWEERVDSVGLSSSISTGVLLVFSARGAYTPIGVRLAGRGVCEGRCVVLW
jgi:hypothetical protein